MTILTLQRRIHEVGRIRAGEKGQRGNPVKLDTWRLTSPQQHLIEAAADLYGGNPQPWQSPTGNEWEVVTEAAGLPVILPPTEMAFSQFYETWSGGGCTLRCDGIRELIGDQPCVCDPEARDCKPTTRLSVILPDLPGFGVWRVESHGYYSAVELAGAVELIQQIQTGALVPAELRLVERLVRRPGQQARRFKVVTLDARLSAAQLMAATGAQMIGAGQPSLHDMEPEAIEAGQTASPLTPVPRELPTGPTGTVAAQAARVDRVEPRPKRRGAAPPVTPTGLAPRTAAQAAADVVQEPPPPPEEPSAPAEPTAPAGPWQMNDQQRALLMAQLSDASVDDVMRGQLVGLVTDGRATSSKDLRRAEFDMVLFIAKSLRDDVMRVDYDADGSLLLQKDDGSPVDLAAMRGHFERLAR